MRAIFLSLLLATNLAIAGLKPKPLVLPRIEVEQKSGNFVFRLCDEKNECEILGSETGYTRTELESWKNFREAGWQDTVPLLASVSVIPLWLFIMITGVTLPVSAVAATGVAILGTFVYFFVRHPQTQSGMTNAVYGEFQSRPELLAEFKNFLRSVDQGEANLRDPRVLSSGKAVKTATGPAPASALANVPPAQMFLGAP